MSIMRRKSEIIADHPFAFSPNELLEAAVHEIRHSINSFKGFSEIVKESEISYIPDFIFPSLPKMLFAARQLRSFLSDYLVSSPQMRDDNLNEVDLQAEKRLEQIGQAVEYLIKNMDIQLEILRKNDALIKYQEVAIQIQEIVDLTVKQLKQIADFRRR